MNSLGLVKFNFPDQDNKKYCITMNTVDLILKQLHAELLPVQSVYKRNMLPNNICTAYVMS